MYCHPAYLTYIQSTSYETSVLVTHELESRLPEKKKINIPRYTDNTILMAESDKELKSLLIRVKEESEKVGLKLNIKKLRS